MNKSIIAGVAGCIAGVSIIGIAVWCYGNWGTATMGPTGPKPDDGIGKTIKPENRHKPVAPLGVQDVERSSMPQEALERLPETQSTRTNKGRFIISGQGEDSDWGFSKQANFLYTADVVADSKILEKKSLPRGGIKVVELRTFRDVRDSMIVSEADVKLSLKTVNIKLVSKAIDLACAAWSAFTSDVSVPGGVKVTKDLAERKLKEVDGKGIRHLLGVAGLDIGDKWEKKINELASRYATKALGNIRRISGKSYLVTYYQSKDAEPMYATFKNEDGSEITDEEEQLILRRVNAFMDYCLVPDKKCRPGDTWKVHSEDLQEVFDPFVEGDYIGMLTLMREENNDEGNWVISVGEAEVKIISSNGKTTGTLQVKSGCAEVNPKTIMLESMSVNGDANIMKKSKHHWLFTAHLGGTCEFEGQLFVDYDNNEK